MSELFKESGPFAVGIADIDEEHAALHIDAKRVAAALAQDDGREGASKLLDAFVNALEQHFNHEERHFGALGSERAEAHRKEHEMLVLSLKLFSKTVKERDSLENWSEFVNLDDMLMKHIILYDLELRSTH